MKAAKTYYVKGFIGKLRAYFSRDRFEYWLYEYLVIASFLLSLIYVNHSLTVELGFLDSGSILVGLFIFAIILEPKYLDRAGLFPNVIFLDLLLEARASELPSFFTLYVRMGILLSITLYLLHDPERERHVFCRLFTPGPYKGSVNRRWLCGIVIIAYSFRTIFAFYMSYYILGSFDDPNMLYSFIYFFILTWLFALKSSP